MAKYSFTVSGSQLIVSLVPVLKDVQPTSMSYLSPSFKIGVGKINAYEHGQPRQSFLFTEIGEIDGVAPTDLQDAFDKLTTATANLNGGGASPLTYNFDLTSPNWASEGVTDEASFINWLATKSLTNIVVTAFNFVGDRIFCNMTADGTIYNLSFLGLVNADKIGVVNGLDFLNLRGNQIVTFNPTIPLPSTLRDLNLNNNQMTLAGYTASETWANAQPAFTNPCNLEASNNIDSIIGTNLRTILLTKNCSILL